MSEGPEWGCTVHQWQRWFPVAILLPVLPFFTFVALGLLHPESPFRLLPQWGTTPSVNQVIGISCIVMAIALVFDAVAAQFATAGPPPVIATFAGQPATVLRRGAVRFTGDAAVLTSITLLLATLGWLSLRVGSTVIAALLFVPTAWLGAVVVLIALRRYTTGGVWLTPTGFTDRFRGTEVTLAWDDVARADYGSLDFAALLGGAPSVLFGGEFPVVVGTRRQWAHAVKHVAGIWRSPRKPTAGAVFLETRELGINPGTLARVVVHYAQNPSARSELGTEQSLTTVAALHDDSDATRVHLSVAPAPAVPLTAPPPPPPPRG